MCSALSMRLRWARRCLRISRHCWARCHYHCVPPDQVRGRLLRSGVSAPAIQSWQSTGSRIKPGMTWIWVGMTWICHCGHRAAIHARTIVIPFVSNIGHIRQQQLQHHLLAFACTRAVGLHLHSRSDAATETRRQISFPLDLYDTGAAIARGALTILLAKVRNIDAVTLGGIENAFALLGQNRHVIEPETDRAQVSRRSRARNIFAHSAPDSAPPAPAHRSMHRP